MPRSATMLFLIISFSLGLWSSTRAQDTPACPGAPPPRLTIGSQGQMSAGPANNLRAEPSTRGEYLGQLEAGDIFNVLAGAVCADGYAWWLIDRDGLIGWTPEGVNRDYWLEPYPAPLPTPVPPAQTLVPPEIAFSRAPLLTTLANDESVIALLSAPASGEAAHLYVMNPDGSNVRLVAAEDVNYPVWSPDGRWLLYGAAQLHWLNVQTGETFAAPLAEPAFGGYGWSPDSTRIVFTAADPDTGYLDLLILDVRSGVVQNLTRDPGNERLPSWSSDGRSIIFLSDRSGVAQIYRLDLDGGGITQLTFEGWNNWPVWSPDGTRIAWISGQMLMTMNRDGQGMLRWTLDNTANYAPVWSPDGTKIAYTNLNVDGVNSYLYVLDTRGGIPTQLFLVGADDPRASWSPDGRQLVFQSYDGLYRINADGTELTRIAEPLGYPAMASWRPSVG